MAGLSLLIAVSGCSSLGAYDACRKESQGLGDLDACMAAKGYSFVPEDATWNPSLAECWDDRYAGTMPMAYCYVQTGPGGPEVPAGYPEVLVEP
jgi:hypothetical protein